MKIDIVSIFPAYLDPLRLSLVGKARASGLIDLAVHDLRDWTHDRHRTVDDTPYGGGAGMVMRPEPWGEALDALAAGSAAPVLVIPTPSGRPFTQAVAAELAAQEHLLIACGRYEGIDARVADDARRRIRVSELSIGDYVLNGGEAAALVIVESVVRLLPGVLGNPESLTYESYAVEHDGLLEGPVYTKPPSWRGLDVPEVLLSGHHGKVAEWRRSQAIARTAAHRPELVPQQQHSVSLERARTDDAGEILTIERAAYLNEGVLHGDLSIPPLTETLAEVQAAIVASTVLVARRGARVVGSVRGESRGDAWYVGRLMVAPDQQGAGIGRLLLSAVEAAAPTTAARIELSTGGNSARNLAFYARRGYREVGRTGGPDEVPLVWLAKPRDSEPGLSR